MRNNHFVIILMLLYIIVGCTNSSSNINTGVVEALKDTLVGEFEYTDEPNTKNFYLIIEGDTSNLYCRLERFGFTDEIKLTILNDPKHTYIEYLIENNIDTVVEKSVIADSLTYNEQIHELKYIFTYLAKTYDLTKISLIRFDVASITDFSQQIGQVIAKYDKDLGDDIILASIESTVRSSIFINDLRDILLPYAVAIDNIWIWENKYFSNLAELKNLNKGDKLELFESISKNLLVSSWISVRLKKV